MALHTFDLVRAAPESMELGILAGGIEGGRSLAGDAGAIDFSAGGLWVLKYRAAFLFSTGQHKYATQLQFLLNSRARSILVPFMTDWIAPVPSVYPDGEVTIRTPHSDGTPFSDGSEYSQPSITAFLGADAILNAGTITITVTAGSTIFGGEIFGVQHPTKNWRCYGIQEVDSAVTNIDGSVTYVVGITPPLREAASSGIALKFDRPLCLMRLQPSATLGWNPGQYWIARSDFPFIEAF